MSAIDIEKARFNMIEQQIRPWDVLDQRVLNVIATTPREHFVPPRYRNLAFADVAIPLGHNQVMMRPNVEGRMLQALGLQASDSILEMGTGSGYITACLAKLGGEVVSMDIFPEFIANARQQLEILAISNTRLYTADCCSSLGDQRFDAIAITGSLPLLPDDWRRNLNVGGRLFVIVGELPVMEAVLITRSGEREWLQESLFDSELPPLIGANKPVVFEF